MNKEELLENISILDDKDIFEKLDKNKELRDWFLVELNVSLQRSENVVANLEDRRKLRCYKNAVTSLEVESQKYKEVIYTIKNILNNQMDYREFVDIVNAIEEVIKEVE